MALGTKNLGLIKAIHVGVNPPLNTKILWYNDATTPYTTGPAKVHYYYDVILADWYPLVGVGDGVGTFTYIAFADNCEGTENFSLELNPDTHCYWAIHTSAVELDPSLLVPALFENMWTQFCHCDMPGEPNSSGTYTYLAFADDCEGTNFGFDLKYEVDCEDCLHVETYNVNSGDSSFAINPATGGIDVTMTNALAGQSITIDLLMENTGLPLTDLLEYCVEVTAPVGFVGEVEIHLGTPGDTATLNGPATSWKTTHVSNGSQLIMTIPASYVGAVTGTFNINVGTKECCAEVEEGEEEPTCWCCRECWAILVSPTMIEPEDLTAELFAGKWIPIGSDCDCDCDCDGQFSILSQQIEALNQQLEDYMFIDNKRVQDLTQLVNDIKGEMDECCANLQTQIQNLTNQLNALTGEVNVRCGALEDATIQQASDIKVLQGGYNTEALAPLVQPTIDSSITTYNDTTVVPMNEEITASINTSKSESEEWTQQYVDSVMPERDEQIANHETRITALEG